MESAALGTWWRFNRYEINQQGGLVPSSGAPLTAYDPWESFWEWREDWRDKVPPYIGLLDLLFSEKISELAMINAMRGEGSALHKLSRQGKFETILKWCSENGVMGFMPHTTRTLCYSLGENENHKLIYQRVGDGWETFRVEGGSVSSVRLEDIESLNTIIGPGCSFSWAETTSMGFNRVHPELTWNYDDKDCFDVYINDDACGVLSERVLPLPLSDLFWQVYNEPFVDFISVAIELYETLSILISEKSSSDDQQRAAHRLNLYAEPLTRKVTVLPSGERKVSINAPSLLSHFAAMMMIDLEPPNRLYLCKSCNRIFASGTSRAAFCSSTCRNRFNRREYLARQKDAKTSKQD